MHDNVKLFLIKQKVFARLALHEANDDVNVVTSFELSYSFYSMHTIRPSYVIVKVEWRIKGRNFFTAISRLKIRKCISAFLPRLILLFIYLFNWHLSLHYVSETLTCMLLRYACFSLFQCFTKYICGCSQAYKIFN